MSAIRRRVGRPSIGLVAILISLGVVGAIGFVARRPSVSPTPAAQVSPAPIDLVETDSTKRSDSIGQAIQKYGQ